MVEIDGECHINCVLPWRFLLHNFAGDKTFLNTMQIKFPWKRFWCPPEGKLHLDNWSYLTDPEGEYGKDINPDVVSFEIIRDTPCLILLGEPGIGKSQTIEDEIEHLQKEISEKDELQLRIDLKEYGSEDRLIKDLFESETWKEFTNSSNKLHIFVDSLDEGGLRIPQVSTLILKGLEKAPVERLSFRIACRTAEWPWSFREGLSQLWGKEQVKVYELAPLRLIDVQKAANLVEVKATEFIESIHEKNAGPLASKPITLNFLLNLFRENGGFPESQVELYEKGCLNLCEEPDLERREKGDNDKRYVGHLTSGQRLAVASRVAAVLIFSNRIAVYKDIDQGDLPDDCLTIRELVGGKEKTDSGTFDISEDSIKETLKTGLFTSRGAHLMGFAHQTYAEFLAARYLKDAPFEQVKNLLGHPYNVNKIIPQLHEIATWLGGQRRDVSSWLLSIEPEILLQSDIIKIDNKIKENLVSSLLVKFKEGELFDSASFYRDFHKLSHPGIAEQLRPLVNDKVLPPIARNTAIGIAETCNVKGLQDILVERALDQTENYHIRVQAARAVFKIADEDSKKKLEPLAKGEAGNDPDNELRTYGMRCMWPKHWNTTELLKNIAPPNEHFFGTYHRFLKWEVIPQIPTPDLLTDMPLALNIISKWPYRGGEFDLLGVIADEIILSAWGQLPDRSILLKLAELILYRIKSHKPICDEKVWQTLSGDHKNRHAIVKFMIEELNIDERTCYSLIYRQTPLILNSDFYWLLEQIEASIPEKQGTWAGCILNTLRGDHPVEWISRFLEVHARVPALEEKYPAYWEFDSKLSRDSKANYLRNLRWEQQNQQRLPKPPISERIEASLRMIEEGNVNEWHKLTYNLSCDPATGDHEWRSTIQNTPGWKNSYELKQIRIVEAANKFLLNNSPESDEWFGSGSYTWKIFSTYLAIRFIAERKDNVDSIPDDIWVRLVPYMLDDSPVINNQESFCLQFELAFKKAPEATKLYLLRLIECENERHGRIFFIDHLKNCWKAELTPVILNKLKSCDLKPGGFRDLTEFLFDIGVPDVEEVVVNKIDQIRKEGISDQEMVIELFVLLFLHWSGKHWSLIWELFQEQPELAEGILYKLADRVERHNASFADNLEESHLAELYLFMSNRFPPGEDPKLEGEVTARHSLGELRSSLLKKLVNMGTKEACTAIESLVEKLPEQRSVILRHLREAQINTLKKTWQPLMPSQVIDLLQDRHRRFVDSEEQLLSVIIESLNRMQDYYKGDLPAVERLWSWEGGGNNRRNYRPKDEESLSDEIARWFRDDLSSSKGIIVNREVQPRRGQKTDIYVNAVKLDAGSGGAEPLTVVIEVKGCWHDEVMIAMETQLLNRYMKENNLAHGLYIVGWFMCDRWDDKDSTKSKTPKMTIEDIKGQLEDQAKQLGKNMGGVSIIEPFVLNLAL